MLQLVQSHWMDLLYPQSCKPSAGFYTTWSRNQTPALFSSAPYPGTLGCFLPSTVLQLLHIKFSLSLALFFFSFSFLVKLHKPRSTSAQ